MRVRLGIGAVRLREGGSDVAEEPRSGEHPVGTVAPRGLEHLLVDVRPEAR